MASQPVSATAAFVDCLRRFRDWAFVARERPDFADNLGETLAEHEHEAVKRQRAAVAEVTNAGLLLVFNPLLRDAWQTHEALLLALRQRKPMGPHLARHGDALTAIWHRLPAIESGADERLQEETAATIPPASIKEPRRKQFQAYWAEQAGRTQTEIANWLNTTQGNISKWIATVKQWRDAGNKMPEIPRTESLNTKPMAMDPEKIDLGPRADHRTPAQIEKLAQITGHGWNKE